jgi:hypothetical protein
MTGLVKRVFADRARGRRPGAPQAMVAAAAAGVAAAGITYRVLRG